MARRAFRRPDRRRWRSGTSVRRKRRRVRACARPMVLRRCWETSRVMVVRDPGRGVLSGVIGMALTLPERRHAGRLRIRHGGDDLARYNGAQQESSVRNMTASLVQETDGRQATRRDKSFRPDVEGMRAVAVGLVLLYHAGVGAIPGGYVGVDVFFVISGFLITGMLVREVQTTGRVSLSRFYARRIKRLLPAAALVLVVTAVLTRVVMSVIDWRAFGGDIVAAAAYLVNWRLADRSVDYLAEDVGAS